ncbi:TonB-dependent receptor [Antarcticibacterium arcticum]|uniref:TonB-dependent receptor n=1 Tax=Antarcticibacterium arcticum TaxID=2585771 RepID=A0A5B8YKF7_9FLAO|nr:TonB-dependent receptor [Antarcticibacterium arcticum]QED38155.1 TonB-dependent receptor [Antarcticibacterium arcticum]
MKKRLNGILTLLLVLAVQLTFAQNLQVTGAVTDADGMPLPGVNVIVRGTNTGATTDFDGKYTVNATQGQVLVFSFVGYVTQNVTVGAQSVINVSLTEDAAQLDEVIVLGYSTRGVEEVTGSSVQIGGEDIAEAPMVSVDQALQGKVAGLQVTTSSGTPGSAQDIRIRGQSSLTAGNEPLYVIDGVPVTNSNQAGSANVSSLNPLAAINSQDIASITVLKDASATAAYGARGSNGVIVVTTKRGRSGDTQFNFTSQVGIQNDAYNKRDVLTGAQRLELLGEALVNSYGANGTSGNFGFTPENAIPLAVQFGVLPQGTQNYDGTDYDWSGLIKNEDALLQNYTFSATGGDELSSFYASVGYNKTEATVIGAAFERLNGAFNFSRKMRENMNFSTSLNVSNTIQNPILEQGSFFSNPFITRYLMNPFNNPFDEEGNPRRGGLQFGSLHNTLYVTENNIARNMLTRALSNTRFDWEFFENLTFRNTFSLDWQVTDYKNYQNRYEGDSRFVNGSIAASDNKALNLVYQGGLNYNFKVGQDHNFDVTGLFEYQKNQNQYLFGYGNNFPADGLTNIASASAEFDAFSSFTDWYNVSYLGLLNYNFAGKYVLDATIRREGSSRFGPGNRFGTFGSVGTAWNVHREDFMRGSVFNTLRLRASYGVTGNNAVGLNAYQALLGYGADYSNNGGATPTQFGNADLTWEKGETFDVGFTFGVFENRLTGSFAYYNRRTYDLLQSVPLSRTTGFANQDQNLGEMTNKGIEAELAFDVVRTTDFSWNISGNVATVDNEVTVLAVGADGNDIDPLAGSVYKTTRVGLPAGTWFMRTWAGVDTQTGLPTWFVNGRDGEVTSNYNAAERVEQGVGALPTYSGGLGTRLQFRGFFAEADVYFQGGHKIYEQFAQFYLRTNNFTLGTYNGAAELMDRWQQPGDVTNVPAVNYARNDNFFNTSTRHLYDGDFVRLRNVAVGYNLPSTFAQSIGISGLTLTLRGTNLATWVKDDGLLLDPETQAIGYTTLTTPPVETYTLGINVKF